MMGEFFFYLIYLFYMLKWFKRTGLIQNLEAVFCFCFVNYTVAHPYITFTH